MSEECYVYVMGQDVPKPYEQRAYIKIGMSSNPSARLAQLQTGFPLPLRLYKAFRLPSRAFALSVEQQYHKTNAFWALQGEWQHCYPAYAAEEVASYCLEQWFENGFNLRDVALLCDKAGISCEILVQAIQGKVECGPQDRPAPELAWLAHPPINWSDP